MNLSIAKQKLSEEIAFLENFFLDLHHSRFWRYVLVFFVIYLIAVAAILRADVQYIDDVGRSALGYQNWQNWSRYLSVHLSTVIHGNTYLTDMAPMTQFLCLLFMSLASAIIVCVFTDQNQFRLMHVIAVLPLTISPYFLECISFRYDSPYMGLSVLAIIFPFLFLGQNRFCFSLFSIVGTLIMCTTYQAFSGIYPIMLLFWGLKTYLFSKELNYRNLFTIILFAGLLFIGTLGFYKAFLVHEADLGYGVSTTLTKDHILYTLFQNAKKYIYFLRSDLPLAWKYCIALIVLLCIGNFTIKTKRNRLIAFSITCLTLAIGLIFSYGAYLALSKPLFGARAMCGFGAWLALLSLIGISTLRKNFILNAATFLLCLWFIGYANLYGNALAEQKRWENFRTQLIFNDLNQIPSTNNEKFVITGGPTLSPAIKNWRKKYPILSREVGRQLGTPNWWLEAHFRYYYNLPNKKSGNNIHKQYSKEKLKSLPIIFDRRYHTIYRDGEYIIVNLK